MNPTLSFAPFRNLLQVAYVTTDFDRALREFGEHYGVSRFLELRDLEIEVGPQQQARTHIGLAWVGAVQLEIIEPRGGVDTVYRWRLPVSGYATRLHHLAQLIETESEFEALERQIARGDMPVAIRGSSPGMARYLYTDQRETLGHFVEHIWYSEQGRAGFEHIPRN